MCAQDIQEENKILRMVERMYLFSSKKKKNKTVVYNIKRKQNKTKTLLHAHLCEHIPVSSRNVRFLKIGHTV
jgi:hypothetical protein